MENAQPESDCYWKEHQIDVVTEKLP
jgi:hypothetical protein